jgi:hemerythrin-like domain-containing protein
MLPTQVLEHEHEVILKMLEVIRAIARSGEIEVKTGQEIIDFIRNFSDHCHHAKEEKILFIEAEKYGVPAEGGPIGMMLIEHDEGRGYVKKMDQALQKVKKGDSKAWSEYFENAQNFAGLLEQHISKENQILYPMINMHLPEEIQRETTKKFEKVEKEEVGEGVHQKYHNLVEELEKKYLSAASKEIATKTRRH